MDCEHPNAYEQHGNGLTYMFCPDRGKNLNVITEFVESVPPVSGAGQLCSSCANVHDLSSDCPPPNAEQYFVTYPCGCSANGPTPLPQYCGVHHTADGGVE
jgi:hypothetical protein